MDNKIILQIADFSSAEKSVFYVTLAKYLSEASRGVWANTYLSADEKIRGMRWLNEAIHTTVSRVQDLHHAEPVLNDTPLLRGLLDDRSIRDATLLDEVRHAVKMSYLWVKECGDRHQPASPQKGATQKAAGEADWQLCPQP